jgi:hypothetical protein
MVVLQATLEYWLSITPADGLVVQNENIEPCFFSRNSIERLVEDLIAESMARGDFDNLPGAGKPLDYSHHNPLVDTHTHNLNKILINNGYVPEWVTLDREIT